MQADCRRSGHDDGGLGVKVTLYVEPLSAWDSTLSIAQMSWKQHIHHLKPRLRLSVLPLTLLLCVFFIWQWRYGGKAGSISSFEDESIPEDGVIPLPPTYPPSSPTGDELQDCDERYGTSYIRKFSASATNHCNNDTTASLTCFTHKAHDTRTDSFCVGFPATVDPVARTVQMMCPIRAWTDQDRVRHAAQLSQFPAYWYNTGPGAIFDQYVHLDAEQKAPYQTNMERAVLLVKREDTVDNLWHTLMQVMSVWLALDILRTTASPITQKPFLSGHDAAKTQTVILDGFDDGPFFELWNMFGALPTRRLHAVASSALANSKILIPLPGGSNPFWSGDWVDLDCGESVLLQAFSRRILDFYSISQAGTSSRPLTLVMIDRQGQRGLDNQDALYAAVRRRFPSIKMELIDFAQMPLAEQLRKIQSTDILAGVHGAGLTHGMFLKLSSRSTVVEILPPQLEHRGFKNMAKFLGHRYFSAHGTEQEYEGKSGDWHKDKVFIEEDRLLALLGEAIAAADSEARKS